VGPAVNGLIVKIFSSGTTPVNDPLGELKRIENIRFSTGYPGGLYLKASMLVSRDITRDWLISGAQRLVIYNGLTPIFEGKIADLNRALQGSGEGVKISATGYWGALLGSRRLRRLYADSRTSEAAWPDRTGADAVTETINIIRYDQENDKNQLRIVPQSGVDWGASDRARLRYTAPTGEEIRRMDFDYDFSEGAQVWTTKLQDVDNASDEWTLGTSGTGTSQNIEPATGCTTIDFFLTSTNAQTVPADQTVYSELSNVTLYATMNHAPGSGKNTVDLTEIAKDIRAEFTDLSADEFEIDSNTLSLVPFIADRFPTAADVLVEAASYGDSSQNRWAVGLYASELSTDDKPLLFVEQYPVLTDYDYAVRVDEPTLEPPFDISEGYIGSDENNVWNWIVVQYRDEQGFRQYVTPDDDANLKDADSITDWGQRDYLLRIRHGDAAAATNFGRRFLAAHKDPVWHMTRPIKVKGSIRSKSGNLIPASEIRAGKRIRVENFLRDPALGTDYDDTREVCTITTGRPDSLDVILAQQALEAARL
jgi:hypothetical protein